MRNFKINEQQLVGVIGVLSEFPHKHVDQCVKLLQSLEVIPEKGKSVQMDDIDFDE